MRKYLLLGLLCGGFIWLGAGAASAQQPAAAQPAAFAGGGAETCLKCHNEHKVNPILQTPHAVKGDAHSPFGQEGCESCHGPSAAHVASRSNEPSVVFKGPNISPLAERNAQCLTCHQAGLRMNWQGSQHQTNDVACTNCHQVHTHKDPMLLKQAQAEKCFTCHAEQRSQSLRYSHHPLREGKITCSDCHNPHGSAGPKLLKEVTLNETCYNCHADKRGPVLWEHQPVRENCMNCHTPHGSNQPRLLVQRPPYLCQECHSNSGHQSNPQSGQQLPGKTSILNGSLTTNFRAFGRGCVNCHSQIHGSNSPAGLWFTR
jgi:DmsE family decaheme c-type cytochrome